MEETKVPRVDRKDPRDENAVVVAVSPGRSSLGDSGVNKIILLTPHSDESRKRKAGGD